MGFKPSSDTTIFPPNKNIAGSLKTWKNRFKCMDDKNISLWGDYNTEKAQNLMVMFEMCEGRADCKSEEEIRDWLKQKFIVLLYNTVSFDPSGYDQDTLIRESKFHYVPFSSRIRERKRYKIEFS